MAIIEKKIWPKNFEAILDGSKKCELRLGDQAYAEGDVLNLREWDPKTKTYTGRTLEKKITHVSGSFQVSELPWSIEEIAQQGLVLLSIE